MMRKDQFSMEIEMCLFLYGFIVVIYTHGTFEIFMIVDIIFTIHIALFFRGRMPLPQQNTSFSDFQTITVKIIYHC